MHDADRPVIETLTNHPAQIVESDAQIALEMNEPDVLVTT